MFINSLNRSISFFLSNLTMISKQWDNRINSIEINLRSMRVIYLFAMTSFNILNAMMKFKSVLTASSSIVIFLRNMIHSITIFSQLSINQLIKSHSNNMFDKWESTWLCDLVLIVFDFNHLISCLFAFWKSLIRRLSDKVFLTFIFSDDWCLDENLCVSLSLRAFFVLLAVIIPTLFSSKECVSR